MPQTLMQTTQFFQRITQLNNQLTFQVKQCFQESNAQYIWIDLKIDSESHFHG